MELSAETIEYVQRLPLTCCGGRFTYVPSLRRGGTLYVEHTLDCAAGPRAELEQTGI